MQQLQAARQGYKITDIGEIPERWKIAILNELSKKITDIDHKMPKKVNDGIPFLSVGYLVRNESQFLEIGTKDNQLEFISNEDYEYHSKKFNVEYDDLLYSRFGTIGIAKLVNTHKKMIASYSIVLIKPRQDLVMPLFLAYMLNSAIVRKQAMIMTQGSSNQNFHLSYIKVLKIPVPPIAEQQKIASILSKVDELIQKTDQIIEQIQRLKKGLMQRLLTKGIGHTRFKATNIGQIPEEWEVSIIGELCKVGSGGTPSRTRPEYFEGSIPWVKTTELNYNVITDTEEKITETALKESAAKVYPKGTFLVAMIGLEAEGTRGKCAILGIDAAVNQACAAIQPTQSINLQFLFYYYQTLRNKIMSLVGGTKRMNLNQELVKSIEIPVPQFSEQQKIVLILSNMDSIIEKEIHYKAKLNILKKGLMQKLLTGKIRVKL